MDLLIKRLLAVVIPLALFGLIFYHDGLYRFVLLQNDHIKHWYFPRDNLTDYTPSIDYFNLERMLATCRKCPKTIVYQVSELGFKNEELETWRGEIYDNIESLYIDSEEENKTLQEAAGYDSFYNDVYYTMQLNRIFHPYLLRKQLLSMVKKNLYNLFFRTPTVEASQIDQDPLVGPIRVKKRFTRIETASQIKLLKGLAALFEGYKTGKSNELFFRRFVAKAKARNIRVVFVELPLTPLFVEDSKSVQEAFQLKKT